MPHDSYKDHDTKLPVFLDTIWHIHWCVIIHLQYITSSVFGGTKMNSARGGDSNGKTVVTILVFVACDRPFYTGLSLRNRSFRAS
jgi:hypothetical protein